MALRGSSMMREGVYGRWEFKIENGVQVLVRDDGVYAYVLTEELKAQYIQIVQDLEYPILCTGIGVAFISTIKPETLYIDDDQSLISGNPGIRCTIADANVYEVSADFATIIIDHFMLVDEDNIQWAVEQKARYQRMCPNAKVVLVFEELGLCR